MHKSTKAFLDIHHGIGGIPSLKLLGRIAGEFGVIPYENLTKFIKKHRLMDEGSHRNNDLSAEFASAHLFTDNVASVTDNGQGSPYDSLRLSNEVIDDYIKYGSGGTCFSLTNALRIIAEDLGFTVYPAMADMNHGPNIHCALIAVVGGERYIVDPGYLVVEPVPLRLNQSVTVQLPGHRIHYRPVPGEDAFELFTSNGRGEHVFRYRVRPTPVAESEFLYYWIQSFSANGMNGLHLNRFTSNSRLSAHNLNMRVDDGIRKKNVKLKNNYSLKVSSEFGIDRKIVDTAFEGWKHLVCRK